MEKDIRPRNLKHKHLLIRAPSIRPLHRLSYHRHTIFDSTFHTRANIVLSSQDLSHCIPHQLQHPHLSGHCLSLTNQKPALPPTALSLTMSKTTMRAARLHGNQDVRVDDVPLPVPSPGKALIEIEWCGICGSDLHEFLEGD